MAVVEATTFEYVSTGLAASKVDVMRRRIGAGTRLYVGSGPRPVGQDAGPLWVSDSYFARPLAGWGFAAIFGKAPVPGTYEVAGSSKGAPVLYVSESVPNLSAVVPERWDDPLDSPAQLVRVEGLPACTFQGHPMMRIPSAAGLSLEAVNPGYVSTMLASDEILDATDAAGWDDSPYARPAFRVTRSSSAKALRPVTVWEPVRSTSARSYETSTGWLPVGILMPVRIDAARK